MKKILSVIADIVLCIICAFMLLAIISLPYENYTLLMVVCCLLACPLFVKFLNCRINDKITKSLQFFIVIVLLFTSISMYGSTLDSKTVEMSPTNTENKIESVIKETEVAEQEGLQKESERRIEQETKQNTIVQTKSMQSEETKGNTFTLTAGTTGAYGVEENLDNYEQIIYNVPVGKYSVTFNTNLSSAGVGTIYVQKNDIVTEDGEKIHPIASTYRFNTSNGYTHIVEVKEEQHIFITINSSFTFTEI